MSKCTIDVSYYPFDMQMCELKFASWTTEVTRVSLCFTRLGLFVSCWLISLLKINMSIGLLDRKKILGLYSPSGVFELKKIWAERHEEHDPCCADKFADVTYEPRSYGYFVTEVTVTATIFLYGGGPSSSFSIISNPPFSSTS